MVSPPLANQPGLAELANGEKVRSKEMRQFRIAQEEEEGEKRSGRPKYGEKSFVDNYCFILDSEAVVSLNHVPPPHIPCQLRLM